MHLAAAGQRPRELERGVVGVGSADAEEHPVQAGRRDPDERLLEGDPRLADRRRRHMGGATGLVADGRHDGRMAVPDVGGREAPGKVDEPVAVRVDQDRARGRFDDQRRRSGPPVRGPAPSTARIRSMIAGARGPG